MRLRRVVADGQGVGMRFPDDVPELTSGDLTLRAHRLEDADAVVEQCVDAVSLQWTTVPVGYTRAMAVDWVTTSVPQSWESGSERVFALETTHPDGRRRFSGSLSLRDEGSRRAELAFGAHPAVRGRGVMTRAVNLLLDYGFSDWRLETVIWRANVGNFASRRVAWKTGFTFGGMIPRWLPQRGEYLDGWEATLHRTDARVPTTSWLDVPVLEGRSVRLRPLTDADIPRIVEASADPRSQHWLPFLPHPYTEADARGFLLRSGTRAAEGAGADWAVAASSSDTLLGTLGLPRGGRNGWEIGYLAHPDARGRGAIREAVGLVTAHVFRDAASGGLGARRAYLRASEGNAASRHVAMANGFREYGRERSSETLRDGSVCDMVLYDLLASDPMQAPSR